MRASGTWAEGAAPAEVVAHVHGRTCDMSMAAVWSRDTAGESVLEYRGKLGRWVCGDQKSVDRGACFFSSSREGNDLTAPRAATTSQVKKPFNT